MYVIIEWWSLDKNPLDTSRYSPRFAGLCTSSRIGFRSCQEIVGQRAMQCMASELANHWREAGVLEAYHADLKDRYAGRRTSLFLAFCFAGFFPLS